MGSVPHIKAGLVTGLIVAAMGTMAYPAAAQSAFTEDEVNGLILLIVLAAGAIYLIPSIIAFIRQHPNRWVILVINVVFGGTGIGWLGSLVWAFSAVHRSPTGSHGGESGLNVFVNDPQQLHLTSQPVQLALEKDPAEQLDRLKRLLDGGVIDQGEYQRLRSPLLQKLLGH